MLLQAMLYVILGDENVCFPGHGKLDVSSKSHVRVC